MTITIDNKEYPMEMNGTVGIAMIADSLMNGEPAMTDIVTEEEGPNGEKIQKTGKIPTKRYQYALLYAVFMTSNRGIEQSIDLYNFMLKLTHNQVNELQLWFWKRWNELEAVYAPTEQEKAREEEGKKKASMPERFISWLSARAAWIRRIFAGS